MKKAFKELIMRERGLLALLCVLAGCASPDMEPSPDMAQMENVEKSRNYVIEQITFRHGKDKVEFRDLSDPSYVKYVGVAPLSMGRYREEDFWQGAELRRVAEETLGRAKMFSEKSPVLEKNSALPRICIEIVEQEYVTDGKNSRTTSYYALELSVKVFSDGQSDAEECFMGSASVKEHTSWGTMSFRPIQPMDLYRLFSEALAEALRTGTWSEVKQPS